MLQTCGRTIIVVSLEICWFNIDTFNLEWPLIIFSCMSFIVLGPNLMFVKTKSSEMCALFHLEDTLCVEKPVSFTGVMF